MSHSSPSVSGNPLVSIIVPTYNRGSSLERCVRSVLNQSYRNLECVVMDGASTDESVHILEQIKLQDTRLRYVSEPDEGEVSAVNKGLDLARGDIVGFQASDDFYTPDAVRESVEFLLKQPKHVGVSADAEYVDESGRSLQMGVVTYRGIMASGTIRKIIINRYKACPVCHGSFFGWRERLLKHGKLNPTFSVTPDWEYYLRLLKEGETIGFIPNVHYKYTVHSEMGAVKYWEKVEKQLQKLHEIHGITALDRVRRATTGRARSYFANPYRTPLLRGIRRELLDWIRQRRERRSSGN